MMGVPNTAKQVIWEHSFPPRTCESTIGARKISDIPKIYYSKYCNHFLQQKMGTVKKPHKMNISVSMHLLESKDSLASPVHSELSVHHPRKSPENATPRDSFSNQSLDQLNEGGKPSLVVHIDTTTEKDEPKGKATSPLKNWWSSIVTPKTLKPSDDKSKSTDDLGSFPAGLDETINVRKKSFLERLISDFESRESLTASNQDLNKDEVEDVKESPAIELDGHVFRELIVNQDTDRMGNIEGSPTIEGIVCADDEDIVDRFGSDSGSSDDVSRSDASTLIDHATLRQISRPPSGRRLTPNTPTIKRPQVQPYSLGRTGTAKKAGLEICKVCRLALGSDRILMCESIFYSYRLPFSNPF